MTMNEKILKIALRIIKYALFIFTIILGAIVIYVFLFCGIGAPAGW